MANIILKASDITGDTLENGDAVVVTVKGHPVVDGDPKVFDTSLKELEALKTAEGLIELEIRQGGNLIKTVYATRAEFAKLVPDEKVKTFSGNKGRRPGWSPSSGNH